jgi:hypothetical protein
VGPCVGSVGPSTRSPRASGGVVGGLVRWSRAAALRWTVGRASPDGLN